MRGVIQEVSVVPGRIRLKCSLLKSKKGLAAALEGYLGSVQGVKNSRVNSDSTSIVVIYDPGRLKTDVIKDKIISFLEAPTSYKRYFLKKYQCYGESLNNKKRALTFLLLYSAIFIYLQIKQPTYGKNSIARSIWVLMVVAVIDIISGYPKLKNAVDKTSRKLSVDVNSVLVLLGVVLTIARESNEGVFALALKSLNDYIKHGTDLESKKILSRSADENSGFVWLEQQGSTSILLPIDKIELGDVVIVKKGENVQISGEVLAGEAVVNSIYHTGQLEISRVKAGSKVEEGSIVLKGELKIKVLQKPEEFEKNNIICPEDFQLHNEVMTMSNKITRLSMGAALASLLFTRNVFNPISMLLVLCPMGVQLALSTGLQQYAALLYTHGLAIHDVNMLGKINKVEYIIFDKTGTLTKKAMILEEVIAFDDEYSKKDILEICYACEADYYHPIANTFYNNQNYKPAKNKVEHSALIPARGVRALYQGSQVLIGNDLLMEEYEVDYTEGIQAYLEYEKRLSTPIFISKNEKLIGLVVLKESVRDDAVQMINGLGKRFNKSSFILVIGDAENKAQQVASGLGIKKVYSRCNHLDKLEIVEKYKKSGKVMMVGDGMNDLLAMSRADVSVSFANSAYDKTKLKSDCVILDDSLVRIPELFNLSQKAGALIKQSVSVSSFYNYSLGGLALFHYFGPFTAKSINTFNSLIVLLMNQRISHISRADKSFNKKS